MSNLNIVSVEDIVAKYRPVVDQLAGESTKEEFVAERLPVLEKMTKAQLIEHVVSLEYKPSSKLKVVDVVKLILMDEELLTASHDTVAQAVCQLVPGANTSSKSVATYVSKQSEEWGLPNRIVIRTAKPKKAVEETAEVEAEPIEEVE